VSGTPVTEAQATVLILITTIGILMQGILIGEIRFLKNVLQKWRDRS
jgi:hypothetical protein